MEGKTPCTYSPVLHRVRNILANFKDPSGLKQDTGICMEWLRESLRKLQLIPNIQNIGSTSACTSKRLEIYLDAPPLSDPKVSSISSKWPFHKLHAARAGDLAIIFAIDGNKGWVACGYTGPFLPKGGLMFIGSMGTGVFSYISHENQANVVGETWWNHTWIAGKCFGTKNFCSSHWASLLSGGVCFDDRSAMARGQGLSF